MSIPKRSTSEYQGPVEKAVLEPTRKQWETLTSLVERLGERGPHWEAAVRELPRHLRGRRTIGLKELGELGRAEAYRLIRALWQYTMEPPVDIEVPRPVLEIVPVARPRPQPPVEDPRERSGRLARAEIHRMLDELGLLEGVLDERHDGMGSLGGIARRGGNVAEQVDGLGYAAAMATLGAVRGVYDGDVVDVPVPPGLAASAPGLIDRATEVHLEHKRVTEARNAWRKAAQG